MSAITNRRPLFADRIGTDVQAYDADLAAIAALATTSYGRALLTTADQAALTALIAAATTSLKGAVQKADQAAMEAQTADRYPDAAALKWHPGIAKFWAYVIYPTGTPSLAASLNVTSITDTGVGHLTVTIATDFSSANWAHWASIVDSAGVRWQQVVAKDAGSIQFRAFDTGFSPVDVNAMSVGGFGDQ